MYSKNNHTGIALEDVVTNPKSNRVKSNFDEKISQTTLMNQFLHL